MGKADIIKKTIAPSQDLSALQCVRTDTIGTILALTFAMTLAVLLFAVISLTNFVHGMLLSFIE